jgi:organic radical activating enzyme
MAAAWKGGAAARLVVLTGGEPLLQVDGALIDARHAQGFSIALETNGTLRAPDGVDWICVGQGRRAGRADLRPGAEAGARAGGEHRGGHRLLP